MEVLSSCLICRHNSIGETLPGSLTDKTQDFGSCNGGLNPPPDAN
jgi:hypothetical protein